MNPTITGILVKKLEDGSEVWVYPITSSDNVLHGEDQLDEVIARLEQSLSFNIQVGETVPASVDIDTYFMKIESAETVEEVIPVTTE